MKILLILLLFLPLSSCAYWDTYSKVVAEEGAKAADKSLNATLWKLCKAGSVGAIMRKFGDNQKWYAWLVLCAPETQTVIVKPGKLDT